MHIKYKTDWCVDEKKKTKQIGADAVRGPKLYIKS